MLLDAGLIYLQTLIKISIPSESLQGFKEVS